MTWSPEFLGTAPGAAPLASWPMPDLERAGRPAPPPEPEGPTAEEEAYARGLAEGEALAREELQRELAGALAALAGATESLEAVRAALVTEIPEHLAALATAVGAQLLQRELQLDPAVVRDLVRQAIGVLPLEGTIEVRLHPADLSALDGQLDLYAPGGRRLDLQWVADPRLGRGDYQLQTPQRTIDGRIDPMLRTLYESLRDAA